MKLLYGLSALFLTCCLSSKNTPQTLNTIIYPGKPASDTPEVFAPGIICHPVSREGAVSFSPNGKEIIFTKADSTRVTLMYMKFENGQWTRPATWEQSNIGNNSEAVFSSDGNIIYFISNRHAPTVNGSGKIYSSRRTGGSWTLPQMTNLPVTTDKGLWFPAITAEQKLFFGAYLDSIGNYGKSDIYEYDLKARTTTVRNTGSVINSPYEEWDPFIPYDGSYMLFESDRPGGFGGTDIYISLKRKSEWTTPINLGAAINTTSYEVAAKVSPDGKYLFFDRSRKNEQDIHWVKATIIDSIKKANGIKQ